MKLPYKPVFAFALTISVFTSCVASVFAWFTITTNFNPTINGSTVQYYFDAFSGDGKSAANPLIITKPRHLYNFSRLYNLGLFKDDVYYFQLGKQDADGNYKVYVNNDDAELTSTGTSSMTNLTSDTIDMSTYADYVKPVGQTFSSSQDYTFDDILTGNQILLKNVTVDARDGTFTDVGFFGKIIDDAKIIDFNLENLTILTNNSSTELSNADNVGLIVGYADQTASQSITLKK